ncbi:MAG: hypothetical protein E6Q42_13965 [Dechloromonas sp.]|nr:MAG: hypothetical protein E6Q42_13965 [Dechloromonas sp.]
MRALQQWQQLRRFDAITRGESLLDVQDGVGNQVEQGIASEHVVAVQFVRLQEPLERVAAGGCEHPFVAQGLFRLFGELTGLLLRRKRD